MCELTHTETAHIIVKGNVAGVLERTGDSEDWRLKNGYVILLSYALVNKQIVTWNGDCEKRYNTWISCRTGTIEILGVQ